jgi:hypothetical protein
VIDAIEFDGEYRRVVSDHKEIEVSLQQIFERPVRKPLLSSIPSNRIGKTHLWVYPIPMG